MRVHDYRTAPDIDQSHMLPHTAACDGGSVMTGMQICIKRRRSAPCWQGRDVPEGSGPQWS